MSKLAHFLVGLLLGLGVGAITVIVFPVLKDNFQNRKVDAKPKVVISASSRWNEPDNFKGVKFGESLTKVLKKCREGDLDIFRKGNPCWHNPFQYQGATKYELHNLQIAEDIGQVDIYAYELDAKLAGVSITFSNWYFPKMLAILKERYGAPTSTQVLTWQSQGGGTFTNSTAAWEGKRISIYIQERAYKVDEGDLEYVTEDWRKHGENQTREAISKSAKGL